MTIQQLKRIGIVLVIVLALWGLSTIIGRGGDAIEETELIGAVQAAEVDVIEFAGPEDTLRLVQEQPGTWMVNGFLADAEAVANLFTALTDAGTGELAAQNPASHARMGVDEAGGRRLRVTRGDATLVNVFIGRQGRAARTVYVRSEGDDNVYLVESQLGTLASRQVNEWRDKQVVALDTASVTRVEVARGGDRYTLVRGDTTWAFADGTETDATAIRRLLGEFTGLEAQGSGFPTPQEADSIEFAPPVRQVSLFDADGFTLAALDFDSTGSSFWVRHADGETVFKLYQWKANNLTPADSTLRKREQEGQEEQ